MKKIIYLFILFSSFCHAQDYYYQPVQPHQSNYTKPKDTLRFKNYFFSFSIGLSLPVRDYGSRDTSRNFMIYGPDSSHAKGFANLGFHASINGGVFLTPHVGLAVKIAYNENSFDQNTLNTILNGNYSYSINGNYHIWQIMGGAFVNYRVDKESWLWVQGMVGLINADFPSFSILGLPVFPPQISWNFTLPNANAVAYSLSIGYEKAISQNVSFITTLTYLGAELSYPSLTYDITGPYTGLPLPYTQHYPVTMSFGSIDFSLGLIVHF